MAVSIAVLSVQVGYFVISTLPNVELLVFKLKGKVEFSTKFVNSFQYSADLYASNVPHGIITRMSLCTLSNASDFIVGGFIALISIEVRPLRSPYISTPNASFPIKVTLLGIVIDVRDAQPAKASSPIEVTLLGIMIEVKREQLPNV